MKVKLKRFLLLIIVLCSPFFMAYGQDVTFYQQFNGRYDFTYVGNTMNLAENNSIFDYVTTTSSTATLNLNPGDQVEKAYLYWAGCGDGDFEVNLNDQTITPDRTFSCIKTFSGSEFTYFSAFKDITTQIQTTGNGDYTLSNLDISAFEDYHLTRRTNFAGWAIFILYKNPALPLNQINLYDGLQGVPDDLVINLSSLNVLDNANSKVGFIAWEGDALLATEHFEFNGIALSNTLNPINNVFNGTDSVTGSDTLYNMDLDIYDLQNYIQVGDTTAEVKLSSTQDFIMINSVVIKLNSQLPDGSITIDAVAKECDSKTVTVTYTVADFDATDPLPSNTPVSIYLNGQFFQTVYTTAVVPIDGTVTSQVTLHLPDTTPTDFVLKFVVDDVGNGTGIVTEIIESNNSYTTNDSFWYTPLYNPLNPLISCNEGFTEGTFNFASYEDIVKQDSNDVVRFYATLDNAVNETNPILNTTNYSANLTPAQVFVRINNEHCFSITSFLLTTTNCPPTVYNYVSANNDGANDEFFIDGLQNIFLDYKIEIYNRWGRLIWTGNKYTGNWKGYVQDGIESTKASDGTYFYFIYLNDPNYSEPLKGFLYLNH
jgi:gliding motility-associated-like protein